MTADSPIDVSAKAGFNYDVNKKTYEYSFDFKNFPPNTNKTEQTGFLRRHKFLIECNGRGGFNNKELKSVEERLKLLEKLRKKNLVNEQEYQKKREEILAEL
jgi:hypothetical protein